ncbi:MAG: TauD/TfdA family dioxygenase [Proteobacteria bacterium]|nr:TauD/TfdA family dioxygenase [Pseudomonadota bacterium]
MHTAQLGKTFVTEIGEVDASEPISEDAFLPVREAFHAGSILVLRNQKLAHEALIAFSRHFGDLLTHVLKQYLVPEYPEIMRLSNRDEHGRKVVFRNGAEAWHSDLSFTATPSLATILYGEAIPDEGGDTLFCDCYAAYDALDKDVRNRVDGLRAVHSFTRYQQSRFPSRPLTEEQQRQTLDVAHPVVRTHPETGRKSLFLGDDVISHVEGMERTQGKALMDDLLKHSTQDRFVYRHRWRAGDVVVYDNRCTLHRATDYDEEKYVRRLLRTSIKGDPTDVSPA